MTSIATQAVEVLLAAGVVVGPGLSDTEFTSIQDRFGFRFNPDHHDLLSTALPLGPRWPDWRDGSDAALTTWLDSYVDGFIFDAFNQNPPFWPATWGTRPDDPAAVSTAVRHELSYWPRLIPIYGHRFTPAHPAPTGSPVFSVHQTDAIYYGADLHDYLQNELIPPPRRKTRSPVTVRVPYWSQFVESGNEPNSV